MNLLKNAQLNVSKVVDSLLYLDACAAAPPHPLVLAAMAEHQADCWANPSSLHSAGLMAADLLERSRLEFAALFGLTKGEVIFTSGGTEANNLALFGVCRRLSPGRLLLSPLEHQSVKAAAAQLRLEGWQIELLPVDQQGVVKLEELEKLLEPPTRLLSLVWGSAEVGTLQPMAAVAELCKAKGVLLHSDAVQVAGEVLVDLEAIPVDLLSLSAHKFQGPRGVGALLLADGVELQPQIHGGGQEGGHRSGTEPVILAAGMVKALELRQTCQSHPAEHLAQLRDRLMKHLLPLIGVRLSGPSNPKQRLPHHLSLLLSSPEGVPLSGRSMVRAMGRGGVACSSGSACSSGKEIANLNLLALGLSDAEAASSLRFSFGPWLELSDLDEILALFERCLAELSLKKLQ